MPYATQTTAKSNEPENVQHFIDEQMKDRISSEILTPATGDKPENKQDSTDEATKSPKKRPYKKNTYKHLGRRKSRRQQNQEAESVDSMLEGFIAKKPRSKKTSTPLMSGGAGGRHLCKYREDESKWNLYGNSRKDSSKTDKANSPEQEEEYSVVV
mmetsp:Transcript_21690/g.31892  ORF Transcript_21690/g.31892 Transcript_21690/m.31892 type:complete len:156 (+) Transcript_21690:76-543(+)